MTDKTIHTALRLYDTAWAVAMPFLRVSTRLKDGFYPRQLRTKTLPDADIWIQAASGGEAYLAWTLLAQLRPPAPIRILITTNTRQGMDILVKAAEELAGTAPGVTIFPAWFPFDRPSIMDKAVSMVTPKLAVLLESEIWPGFLYALKSRNCPVFIINGRMTPKSMAAYRKFPGAAKTLRPDRILAISNDDAKRFGSVFGGRGVSVMSNIKFDSLVIAPPNGETQRRTDFTDDMLPAGSPFFVLGSVRREEENQITKIIQKIHKNRPDVITGLFPRHLNRLDRWKKTINDIGLKWRLRSNLEKPAMPGDVILWDAFGELSLAYAAAEAVFVGGSLAPLGGQNFLEPLVYGTIPVIGPSYENFAWVGDDIFHKGLVVKTRNHSEAADRLIEQIDNPAPRTEIIAKANAFIKTRQGGTRKACEAIEAALRSG